MVFRPCWPISKMRPTDFTNKFKPRSERCVLSSSSPYRAPILTSTHHRHSNSKRYWKKRNSMIKRLVSSQSHPALHRAPQSPAHSQPYQFNPNHTFDPSYLLLSYKDTSIETSNTDLTPGLACVVVLFLIYALPSPPCV